MKQVIVVRKDIKMSKGKTAAQVAHASINSYLKADIGKRAEWIGNSFTKVILKVDTLEQLSNIAVKASEKNIPCALIMDEGRTQLEENTITCLGIGPDEDEKIDEITKGLKLL